ncbi:MAG: rRNA maturation RNase YbeY [Undibacterium sp.]
MRIRMTIRGEKALRGLSLFFLRKIIRETLSQAFPKVFTAHRTVILDVACVSDEAIAKLNGEYRKKPKPTDILSFGLFEGLEAMKHVPAGPIDLGQIVLSPDFIARSAKEDGVSWKREFTYVFSHGILHLVGFDHEEKMFQIQDAVTDTLASGE